MNNRRVFLPMILAIASFLYGALMLSAAPTASNQATLTDMLPATDLLQWYLANSSYTVPITDVFGVYVALAEGEDLYFGVASGRPAQNNVPGALVALTDGTTLSAIGELDEEGVHEMLWFSNTLHIAGTDPCCGQGFEAGNHYTYQPGGPFIKYRDPVNGLVDTAHTWGLTAHPTDPTLYATTGSVDNGNGVGNIFASNNNGATWQLASTLGDFRIYDLAFANGQAFALYADDIPQPLSFAFSDDLIQWTPIISRSLHRGHIRQFEDQFVMVGLDRQSVYVADSAGFTQHALPVSYTVASLPATTTPNFGITAVVSDTYYLLAKHSNGQHTIIYTYDFNDWQSLASSDSTLISLSYWQRPNLLVIGTAGRDATLLTVLPVEPPVLAVGLSRLAAGPDTDGVFALLAILLIATLPLALQRRVSPQR